MRHLIATLIIGILVGACLVGAVWYDLEHGFGARIEQIEEDNVQDRDATRALIACLRIIDTNAYAFDGGMSQCLDDWYEANAQGDY